MKQYLKLKRSVAWRHCDLRTVRAHARGWTLLSEDYHIFDMQYLSIQTVGSEIAVFFPFKSEKSTYAHFQLLAYTINTSSLSATIQHITVSFQTKTEELPILYCVFRV